MKSLPGQAACVAVALLLCGATLPGTTLTCPAGAVERLGLPLDPEWAAKTGIRSARWCEIDERRSGPYVSYREDGRPYETRSFIEGIQHGMATRYYRTGEVWWKGEYVDGVLAAAKTYGKAGGLLEEAEITRSAIGAVRRFASWREDGTRLAVGFFLDDQRYGTWVFFNLSGNPSRVAAFVRDRKTWEITIEP